MARVSFRNIILAAPALVAALGLTLSLTTPAAAQFYSDGYRFLQAVDKREGSETEELLNEPGSTVVNSRDITTGETGLHLTVVRRDITWTRYLLQEGANPNIADNRGRTPLIVAAEVGFVEGIEALIDSGARIDIANETGETPLISAVHARNVEMIELLVENGADPDRGDNTGRTARDYATLPNVPARVLAAIENNESDGEAGAGRIYGPSF